MSTKSQFATYTTLDGDVVDLMSLNADETGLLDAAVDAFETSMAWEAFGNEFLGPKSAVLRRTGGRVTQAVWDSPMFKVLRDIEDRLGIAQGIIAADGGEAGAPDPLTDTWLPSAKAAEEKGVTLPGLHGAIKAGLVVARPISPGGTRIEVSRNSLRRWQPKAHRP